VVESIYFVVSSSSSSSSSSSIYTGDIAEIIIKCSEPVVVEGAPVLVLFFLTDSGVESQFIAYFDSNKSPTELLFKAYINSERLIGRLFCGLQSTINLNGGRILRQANFLPLLEVSLDLRSLCCQDTCDAVSIEVLPKVPFITRVYSPQTGIYSVGEKIDIFIEFSDPVVVRGSPVITMDLVGLPIANYVHTSIDLYSLQFAYIVSSSDYTSSLDYHDIHSLFINSNNNHHNDNDGIFLHCDTGSIPAYLELPQRGASGSLGHQSQIIINKNRPNLLSCSASPLKATSGDDVLIVLQYSEKMQVVDEIGQLFTSLSSTETHRSLGLSLHLIPSGDSSAIQTRVATFLNTQDATIIFKYSVTGTDPTGSILLSSSIPIIAINTFIVSASSNTLGPAEFPLLLTQSVLSSIDNSIPVVMQVYSSNVSSLYPFGVGDVLDIFIEMSLAVVIEQTPRLRLVLNNGQKAFASYASDNPYSVKILKFHYVIGGGDDASPLEYDGNDALEGLLLRFSTNKPTIIANLNLPDTYGPGSLAFCCNVVVDSTPPYVVSLIPLKRPGVYGENEIIYIMARFSKPVVVVGVPRLFLITQTITIAETQLKPSEIGVATYTSSPHEYDIPIDIRSTDVFFRYVVRFEDNVISLHHTDQSAIYLPDGSEIKQLTNSPSLSADITLRLPGDNTIINGKVERQWKFRYPSSVEILLRDLYHTKPDSLTVTVEHLGSKATLFQHCCHSMTFGHSYPKTHSNTNNTLQSLDTGVGDDFLFSDIMAQNIALRGIVTQSSTRISAKLAIDGNTIPYVGDNSVSETNEEYDAWWQILLPQNSIINSMTIWARKPQTWIYPIVELVIKQLDKFTFINDKVVGKFKLRIQNIDMTNSAIEVTTGFIAIKSTAIEMQNIIESTAGLGNVAVMRQDLPVCNPTGEGCGSDGYDSGYGYTYRLSFLSLKATSPLVTIANIIFPGNEQSKLSTKVKLLRNGYYIQSSSSTVSNGSTNEWLTPFWIFIFNASTSNPPVNLNDSLANAVYFRKVEQIDTLLSIVLPSPIAAKYIKIQRENFGTLSIAEFQVFEERINSLEYYNRGSPVRASDLTHPYQPAQPFQNTFGQMSYDGRWIVQISQDDSVSRNRDGWSGSSGSISEVVVIITDLAGIVHSYYQDLFAEVESLPKYGSLLYTTSETKSPYGDWREAFEIGAVGQLIPSTSGARSLGYCYGPDTTTNLSTIDANQAYTSCQNNYGIRPPLNSRKLGDTAISRHIRNERILIYRPNKDYLGYDYLTYKIYDGLSLQSHQYTGGVHSSINEVLLHTRQCRPFQSKSQNTLISTQSSSFTNDGRHVLCGCAQTETSLIGNATLCDQARAAVCNHMNASDPVIGRDQFLALCLTCFDIRRGLRSTDCQTQTIRAVSLLTSRNLCVPSIGSTAEIMIDCSAETYTERGRESTYYLTLRPPVLVGSFERLKNCFGAYGWYHTPQLN